MTIRQWGCVAVVLVALAIADGANACSVAPFNETWATYGSSVWSGTDSDCRLESSVVEQGGLVGAAIAHYRRHDPTSPFRLSFRVALPSNTSLNILKGTTIARGVARAVPAVGPSEARIFSVQLLGNVTGTKVMLGFFAACGSAPEGGCLAMSPQLDYASFPLRVTLELSIGAASAGSLRYWLGEDTSGSPTGSLDNLDNSRWGGIERVSIGLSDLTAQMGPALAGQAVVFDQISSFDQTEFWSDFDSSDAANVIPNAVAITSSSMQIQGSLCGGSTALPQVASGSTTLRGPMAIHSLPASVNIRQISISSPSAEMGMFLCPLDGGPASPCINSGKSGLQMLVMPSSADRLIVVGAVGALPSGCPNYTMSVVGTLGDQ